MTPQVTFSIAMLLGGVALAFADTVALMDGSGRTPRSEVV